MCRKEEGSQDLTEFFDYGRMPTLTLQEEPPDPTTRTQEALWSMQLKSYAEKQSSLEQNMITTCSIVLGQCGRDMRAMLESFNDWDNMNRNKDAVGLKDAIISFCYHSSPNRHPTITALNAIIRLCSYKKRDN